MHHLPRGPPAPLYFAGLQGGEIDDRANPALIECRLRFCQCPEREHRQAALCQEGAQGLIRSSDHADPDPVSRRVFAFHMLAAGLDGIEGGIAHGAAYKSSPVKSPINFNTMLTFIKDARAQNIMGSVFSKLSEVDISTSASYDDSPAVVSKMLARSDVSTFRSANPGSKIDMFLIPSKSIDTTSISNTADWIVNFYGDTSSLVLWLHPGTINGTIDIISD